MKKIKIFAFLLICSMLVSCGENADESTKSSESSEIVESSEIETAETTEATEAETTETIEAETTEPTEADIPETVENDDFEIIVEELEENSVFNSYNIILKEKNSESTCKYELMAGLLCEKPVLGDVDGDGADEIIVNELVGSAGGAGSYCSYILKYNDGVMTPIFTSEMEEQFDTGFSTTLKDNTIVEILNRFTDFSFDIDYYVNDRFFNDDGTVIDGANDISHAIIDSFNKFYPEDIDNDGIYEIFCQQYVAMSTHVEHIGDAISYLKYNNDNQQFEVVKADFRKPELMPR